MSAVHRPPTEALSGRREVYLATDVYLRIDDALAAGRRLWLRGRLTGKDVPQAVPVRRWWGGSVALPPRTAHLETQVGGQVINRDVPLSAEGLFEVLVDAELAPARRGWRIARNRLTFEGVSAEGCGIVLVPPNGAAGAGVVILPLDATFAESGAGRLARLECGGRLGMLLRRLCQGSDGHRPLYYLACVPTTGDSRQREVAMAIAALGWPNGTVVALPAAAPTTAALTEGLDRLRWLFAGSLDLSVVNLEEAIPEVGDALQSNTDRAPVVCLLRPADELPGEPLAPPGPQSRRLGFGLRPTRATRVSRYPIVFCHGMLATSTLRMELPADWNSFSPARDFLGERGIRALFPRVGPTSGIVERARQLRELILGWTDEPVNVIAHSMGGLDARHMITHMGMADRVRSLTTIASPHRGTYFADWFTANFRHRLPLLLAMEAFGLNVDGFRDCRPVFCAAFNAATPDVPGVRYFSYGAAVPLARVSPMLRRSWNLLTQREGPNDGMVSLASARWGEYLGTLEVDHFSQTPDAVFLHPGEEFNPLGFCLKLVEDLAYRGF